MKKRYYISAQYYFSSQKNLNSLKAELLFLLKTQKIKGTLLLASEGINGTVASQSQSSIKQLQNYLSQKYPGMVFKNSITDQDVPPFYRAKVLIKKEIVKMNASDLNVHKKTGQYVSPKDWNKLVNNSDVILVDARNEYEYDIGTFKNAINPKTKTFVEFPEFAHQNLKKDQKIAMFCTGGIRCEKASAYLLKEGYQEVYQLDGGILNYFEKIDESQSLWEGECFIFDHRVSVNQSLKPGQYDLCHGCRHPITQAQKQTELYKPGVSCPYCYDQLSQMQKKRFEERHKQIQLAKQKGKQHLGQNINRKEIG